MANSTVGRVDFGAKAERNLGGKREHGGIFQTPPCVDVGIKF